MFPFGTPLVTQIVVYGFLLAFVFGAAISLFELVKWAVGMRPAKAPARR